jgi:hypothetical protein
MKKIIYLQCICGFLLLLSSCSSWTYQSTKPDSVWIKVSGDSSDKSYTMWISKPASGKWGNPVGQGTYTEGKENDAENGHPLKVYKFQNKMKNSNKPDAGIADIDSLNENSSLTDVVKAVGNTLNSLGLSLESAISSDLVELVFDKKADRVYFRCAGLPVGGLDAEDTDTDPWK